MGLLKMFLYTAITASLKGDPKWVKGSLAMP